MNKKVLREVYLEKRKTLTASEHRSRSLSVCQQAINLFKNSDCQKIHLFLPIEAQNEVGTWTLYKSILADKRLEPVVSRTDFKSKTMTHYLADSHTSFKEDQYGIPTPNSGIEINTLEIDAVLTPLISFDLQGNRIGYGGGFYDRFLSECRTDVEVIGLAITPPLDFIPYSESHDFKMHKCINHQSVFHYGK